MNKLLIMNKCFWGFRDRRYKKLHYIKGFTLPLLPCDPNTPKQTHTPHTHTPHTHTPHTHTPHTHSLKNILCNTTLSGLNLLDLLCNVFQNSSAQSARCLSIVRSLLVLRAHRPRKARPRVDVVPQQRLVHRVSQ